MDWLWIDFLNSDWHDHLGRGGEDRLDRAAWVKVFRARWNLPAFEAASAGARTRLRRLRDAIRRAASALHRGRRIPHRDLETINVCLASAPVAHQIVAGSGGYRLERAAVGRGLGAALREIAGSFADFVVEQDVRRVKFCENPDCGWVFLDTTRSRTRRWCGSECGNLLRVRKFRKQGTG